MRNWHSTVSSVQENCTRQQQRAAMPYQLTCSQPGVTPTLLRATSGIENHIHAAPTVPLHHVDQTPLNRMPTSTALPNTVVYSTTVNVPQSPARGSAEPHNPPSNNPLATNVASTAGAAPQGACPVHTLQTSHNMPPDGYVRVYSSGQQSSAPFQTMAAQVPGHLQCTCGHINCMEQPRMPFSDATNLAAGAAQQTTLPSVYGIHGLQAQPGALSLHGRLEHGYPFGHPGANISSWSSRNHSLAHDSEEPSEKYKSSALARMQRMQVCHHVNDQFACSEG
jgi:hypothetical protein